MVSGSIENGSDFVEVRVDGPHPQSYRTPHLRATEDFLDLLENTDPSFGDAVVTLSGLGVWTSGASGKVRNSWSEEW